MHRQRPILLLLILSICVLETTSSCDSIACCSSRATKLTGNKNGMRCKSWSGTTAIHDRADGLEACLEFCCEQGISVTHVELEEKKHKSICTCGVCASVKDHGDNRMQIFNIDPVVPSVENCSAGDYKSDEKCVACAMGKYKAAAGPGPCTQCAAGSYASTAGRLACEACPPDTFLAERGATNRTACASCLEGTISVAGSARCSEDIGGLAVVMIIEAEMEYFEARQDWYIDAIAKVAGVHSRRVALTSFSEHVRRRLLFSTKQLRARFLLKAPASARNPCPQYFCLFADLPRPLALSRL